ncbi:hypothetical protein GCM10022415_01030 [Knoellia locipacati]|uniref:Lipoprotein n=1 Tax=Knoellia locipacati TaxID=882824 RepID=A0A512SVR9_9MICO|nr:hypothetical protein [Knoellia locipacati]GEQ12056.1 hypothetical protein KLO01_01030 [Knoellia locipacati]
MTPLLRTTRGTAALAAVTAVVLGSLAACGWGGAEPASRLAAGWSQGNYRDLHEGPDNPGLRTRLVNDEGQRRELLGLLPTAIPAAERAKVQSVDLAQEVIVVGVYPNCASTSHVTAQEGSLRLVVERDEGTMCTWAPTQVDVWAVSREGLSAPIVLRDQRGAPTT